MLVTNFSPPTPHFVVRSKQRNTKEDSIGWIMEKDLFFILFVYNNPSDYGHYVQFLFSFSKSLRYWLVQWQQRSSFKKETANRRKTTDNQKRSCNNYQCLSETQACSGTWRSPLIPEWLQKGKLSRQQLASLRFSNIFCTLTVQSRPP